MKSKTLLKKQLRRKTNPELVETIRLSLKNPSWLPLLISLSGPTGKYPQINLSKIEEQTKAGDTVLIPGKVLSQGNLTKKVRICSLSISSSAKEKLKESKSEFVTLLEEMKKNPKAEGLKLIK